MSGLLLTIAKLLTAGNIILSVAASLVSGAVVSYGGYMLYDSLYTQNAAFSSWDLMQYKPVIEEEEPTLEELQAINSDVNGWIIIPDTNIDYPVVQGENETEYANKDVFGEFSFSGAIYLSAYNAKDFSDPYSMIYGHHVDNGSMFGDIDKYESASFFNEHNKGYIITENGVLGIDFFAIAETNAYNPRIYKAWEKGWSSLPGLVDYLRNNSVYFLESNADPSKRIVALSTCADSETYGRLVLFGTVSDYDGSIFDVIDEPAPQTEWRPVVGHKMNYWSLVNLLCIFVSVLILLPFGHLKEKFGRLKKMKNVNDSLGKEYYDKWSKFRVKYIAGLVGEVLAIIAAIVVFILTENMKNPMTLIDGYTPYMLLIVLVSYIIELTTMGYKNKDDKEKENKEKAAE